MTATSVIPECKWIVASSDDILWAEFDGDFVAYHRPSGKTHLLNEVSEALLTCVLLQPHSVAEVVEALGGPIVGEESRYTDEIHDLLCHFEHLGLVERQ